MKILLLRAFILLATILTVLVLFEYYLRGVESYVVRQEVQNSHGLVEANPELLVDYTNQGRRLLPNAHVIIKNHALSKEDVKIDTNSLGFRYKEINPEKPADEYRVLVLGDSITIEDYLPQDDGWVALTERELNRGGGGQNIELINAALGNFSLEDEVRVLEETRAKVKPDQILIAFYLNDSRPAWGFAGEIGGRSWLRRHSLIVESIYRHFKLAEWVKDGDVNRFEWIAAQKSLNWANDRGEFLKLTKTAAYDWGAAWDKDSWGVIREHLAKLKAITGREGLKTGILLFPVSFQVEATFLEDEPQRVMTDLTAEFGFKSYDLLPALREAKGEQLFYDQCHLTRAGNKVIAPKVAKFVESVKGN